MPKIVKFRPKSHIAYGCIVFALEVPFVASSIVYQSAPVGSTILGALVTGTLAWVAFIRPKLEISNNAVKVVNPFVTEFVGFQDIESVETRWALSLRLGSRKVDVWVAPAPSRRVASQGKIHPKQLRGIVAHEGDTILASDTPNTLSGDAAQIVRVNLRAFQNSREALPRENSWRALNKPALLTLGVSLVGLVVSLILHV